MLEPAFISFMVDNHSFFREKPPKKAPWASARPSRTSPDLIRWVMFVSKDRHPWWWKYQKQGWVVSVKTMQISRKTKECGWFQQVVSPREQHWWQIKNSRTNPAGLSCLIRHLGAWPAWPPNKLTVIGDLWLNHHFRWFNHKFSKLNPSIENHWNPRSDKNHFSARAAAIHGGNLSVLHINTNVVPCQDETPKVVGGFLSHGATPSHHDLVMDDHDLVLKPMVLGILQIPHFRKYPCDMSWYNGRNSWK